VRLLTRSTASVELIEISSYLTEDIPVLEVFRFEVRPADHRVGVDVDVNSNAARRSGTLVETRINVAHRERIRLLRSESICVVSHFPLMLARYNATGFAITLYIVLPNQTHELGIRPRPSGGYSLSSVARTPRLMSYDICVLTIRLIHEGCPKSDRSYARS